MPVERLAIEQSRQGIDLAVVEQRQYIGENGQQVFGKSELALIQRLARQRDKSGDTAVCFDNWKYDVVATDDACTTSQTGKELRMIVN